VAYNVQSRNNKIKLLTQYENVTQKVLLFIDQMLQNAKQLQRAQFYFTGHGNQDNNLESPCMIKHFS
jgi:hypothetical protein